MNYNDIMSRSANNFIIEWQDLHCCVIADCSDNFHSLLGYSNAPNLQFCSLIDTPEHAQRREGFLSCCNKDDLPVCRPPLIALRHQQGHLIHVSEEAIRQEDGRLVSVFTIVSSMVEEKRRVEETQQRLALVLEGTRLGMWDWNPQTDEVKFDELWANMLGVNLSDLTQTLEDWTSRVHPEDLDDCFADINAHIKGESDFYQNTHRMRHADGTWRYILDRGKVAERNEFGQAIRFTGTHTDVTELKQAEERAHKALQERNRFFARISHEIRTPLHGILATADILSRKDFPPELNRLIQVVADSGTILQTLLNDLLDISKIENEQLSLAVRSVNVVAVIEQCFELFVARAKSKKLDFEFDNQTGCDEVYVKSDSARLAQILSNLVSNAIKFTHQGQIKLLLKLDADQVLLEVQDTGVGINDIEGIFEAYQQEGDDASKGLGTGLGLNIVRTLCERLGHSLTVTSTLGQGSCFQLKLGQSNRRRATKTRHAPAEYNVPAKLAHALVVDDNEINLIVASTMLSEFFEQVSTAVNGYEAVDFMRSNPHVDVVFMDLNMPIMGGAEATEQIHQLELDHMPNIVAQTADASDEAMAAFQQVGIDGVLTKPFTRDKVVKLLWKLQ